MTEPRYKAASKTQLANAYNVTSRTFRLWTEPFKEELGAYVGQSYTPKQVENIVNRLGQPEQIELILATSS
jgi:hypothetical protein